MTTIALTGPKAFYQQPGYGAASKKTFVLDPKDVEIAYVWESASKVVRVIKQILAIIIFPIFLYQCLHALAGKLAVPASIRALQTKTREKMKGDWESFCWEAIHEKKNPQESLVYKRVTVLVDGNPIDAFIVGKPSTLNNGRWTLYSGGNGELYEDFVLDGIAPPTSAESNFLFFNYPGVSASGTVIGGPNRNGTIKAYRAMLSFLEEKIQAKQIIGYGLSLGGGIQAEALLTHELKPNVQYVFVKDRTFSTLSEAASHLFIPNELPGWAKCIAKVAIFSLKWLTKILGWNIDTLTSSKQLKAPEIILQTVNNQDKIIGDGVIGAEATLMKALMTGPQTFPSHKKFIGIRQNHNEPLDEKTIKLLTRHINSFLLPKSGCK